MQVAIAAQPGSPDGASEDSTATGPDILVLLDGATARTGTGCIHGVSWFAAHLAEGIKDHAALGPAGALAAAISQTADLHRGTCDLTHPGTPSAAVAIVQVSEGTLRYLVLGDVTVVIDTANGLRVVSDQRVSQTALAERAAADAMHASDPAKAAALVRMKHAELAARNVPGGFWVATTDPAAAEHALTGEIPLSEVRQVATLSDGAARAVDPFGLYDWPGALDVLRESGPGELIRQVRAAEASDPEATRWPRNKLSDDATAAYCTAL
ncbi:hypothetical protein [Promicromonospora panici]|uniref:hypothetical protein n=1 Tax=Promicromonospora panici TaxID=2219658 RepID=UPI00101B7288|nr:hypothetical protein [Promicromonospora panici]